jgi:hypothetical protein
MSNEVMITLLTSLGVLLTTIVSIICYRSGKQTEHRKMQVDIYTTYAIKLHGARASIYPSLYELLSSLIKHIEYGSVTYTDIKTFLDQVNE